MRLSPLFSSPRVAPEPHGANSTDTTPSIADASPQHPLSQAPKSAVAQGTPKSHRGMLASARKSLASLRKQLPLMCMGSATLKAVENPPPRTQQMHGRQTRVDERQPPMPHKTERMQRQEPQQAQPTVQLAAIPPKPPRAQQLHGQQRPLDRRMQPPVPQKCAVTRRSCRSPARWHRSCRPRPSSRDRQWPLRAPSQTPRLLAQPGSGTGRDNPAMQRHSEAVVYGRSGGNSRGATIARDACGPDHSAQ